MDPDDYEATWSKDGKITGAMWKPPLEQSTLECLGPENCGGLGCEEDWDMCYLNDTEAEVRAAVQ